MSGSGAVKSAEFNIAYYYQLDRRVIPVYRERYRRFSRGLSHYYVSNSLLNQQAT